MYVFKLGEIILPVAPSKIEWKHSGNNKTIKIINIGEINVIRPYNLTDFSFDIMLPNQHYPFAVYENNKFMPPAFYLEYIKKLVEYKRYFQFSIIRNDPCGNRLFENLLNVTLESYTVKEDAEQGFDIVVSIKLKQYKDYGTIKYQISENGMAEQVKERPISQAKQEEIPTKEKPKSYTVSKGDTLWAISKNQYGDGSKYQQIADLNGISNPNNIYPGQVIQLE